MEIRMSKVKRTDANEKSTILPNPGTTIERAEKKERRQTVDMGKGIVLHKQGSRYFVEVSGNELEISEDESEQIVEDTDNAFSIIIKRTRKFGFNASMDNLGLRGDEL